MYEAHISISMSLKLEQWTCDSSSYCKFIIIILNHNLWNISIFNRHDAVHDDLQSLIHVSRNSWRKPPNPRREIGRWESLPARKRRWRQTDGSLGSIDEAGPSTSMQSVMEVIEDQSAEPTYSVDKNIQRDGRSLRSIESSNVYVLGKK